MIPGEAAGPRTQKTGRPKRRYLLTPRPAGFPEGMGHIVHGMAALHRTYSVSATETGQFGIDGTEQSPCIR